MGGLPMPDPSPNHQGAIVEGPILTDAFGGSKLEQVRLSRQDRMVAAMLLRSARSKVRSSLAHPAFNRS